MRSYFIESLEIHKLWGYRDINLSFHRDVNILIGQMPLARLLS